MKRALIFLFSLTAAALAAVAQTSLNSEAQRDYMTGNLESAKQKFQIVLAQDPHNTVARNYLKMIAVAEAKVGSGAKVEKQLRSLIIPQVELKEATLGATLDYLRQQAEKLSGGKIQTSFVLKPGVNASTSVTLRLTNIPFTEVLRYVGDLANVQFTFEQYAITVKPKADAAAVATPVQ